MKATVMPPPRKRDLFSPVLLAGIGGLIAIVLAIVATVRLTGTVDTWTPLGPAVATRDLRFTDAENGAVAVFDATSAERIALVQPGDGGFLRVVLRGLARTRRRRGIGAEPPFRLTRWADKALSLEDTATGKRIYLNAFGVSNADMFAQFLPGEKTQS